MWYLLLTICLSGECQVYPFMESAQERHLHIIDSQQECIDLSYEKVDQLKEALPEASVFPLCQPLGEPA